MTEPTRRSTTERTRGRRHPAWPSDRRSTTERTRSPARSGGPRDSASNHQTNPRPAETAGSAARPPALRRRVHPRHPEAGQDDRRGRHERQRHAPVLFRHAVPAKKGYRMIPVNPRYAGQQILGETVVASLDDLPAPPDMVQVFRKADEAPAVVDEAIRAGAKVVWLQLGIRSDEAAAKARGGRAGSGHGPLPQDRIRPAVRRDRLGRRQSPRDLGQEGPGDAAVAQKRRARSTTGAGTLAVGGGSERLIPQRADGYIDQARAAAAQRTRIRAGDPCARSWPSAPAGIRAAA